MVRKGRTVDKPAVTDPKREGALIAQGGATERARDKAGKKKEVNLAQEMEGRMRIRKETRKKADRNPTRIWPEEEKGVRKPGRNE